MSFSYPKHVHFMCLRCALCCGDNEGKARRILLLRKEAERISKETMLSIEKFAEEIEGFEPYIYQVRKTDEGRCIFLEANLCSIYKIRPLICKYYPFQLRNPRSNKYIFTYTNECPGIGEGPQLSRRFFERLFREFKKSMKENVSLTE